MITRWVARPRGGIGRITQFPNRVNHRVVSPVTHFFVPLTTFDTVIADT